MNTVELDAHIAKLEVTLRDIQAELTAAKAFRPFLAKHDVPAPSMEREAMQPNLLPEPAGPEGYGASGKAIRAAIARCPTSYTVYDVERELVHEGISLRRELITQSLSRMARKGEVAVSQRGVGRAPSVYTKEIGL